MTLAEEGHELFPGEEHWLVREEQQLPAAVLGLGPAENANGDIPLWDEAPASTGAVRLVLDWEIRPRPRLEAMMYLLRAGRAGQPRSSEDDRGLGLAGGL